MVRIAAGVHFEQAAPPETIIAGEEKVAWRIEDEVIWVQVRRGFPARRCELRIAGVVSDIRKKEAAVAMSVSYPDRKRHSNYYSPSRNT